MYGGHDSAFVFQLQHNDGMNSHMKEQSYSTVNYHNVYFRRILIKEEKSGKITGSLYDIVQRSCHHDDANALLSYLGCSHLSMHNQQIMNNY